MKRGTTQASIDPTTPLANQLQVLNIPGGDDTPYESLYAVVNAGVKPVFEAFVGARGAGKDGDSKMGEAHLNGSGRTRTNSEKAFQ